MLAVSVLAHCTVAFFPWFESTRSRTANAHAAAEATVTSNIRIRLAPSLVTIPSIAVDEVIQRKQSGVAVPAEKPRLKAASNTTELNLLEVSSANVPLENYLGAGDIDQPAMPVGEWVINTQVWPLGHISRLAIKLWISASGKIDYWEFDDESTVDPAVRSGLDPINETILNPAMRNGVAVASVQVLELTINRE
jgi:hypothetical protein